MNSASNIWLLCMTAGCFIAAYAALILLRIAAYAGMALLEHLSRQSSRIAEIAGEAIAFALAWPIGRAVDHAESWAAHGAEWRAQRAIWRKEFRKLMPWSEFRLKMTGRAKPERDDYADALSLYGLAEPFTRQDLDARFKRIMRGVHPDTGGSDYLAQLATAARTLILKRKGWRQ
jgi:hypothetical protein